MKCNSLEEVKAPSRVEAVIANVRAKANEYGANADMVEALYRVFINKAIGWSLRDYSKTNPKWVKNFINKYRDKLAPISIREASKYV